MTASDDEGSRIRRGYPLRPRAIALVDGECLAAYANYDRVQVCDEAGHRRLIHEIASGDWLLDEMLFTGGMLACAFGTGIMPRGFRLWQIDQPRCVHEMLVDGDGPTLLWGEPRGSRLLVQRAGSIALWNSSSFVVEHTMPLPDGSTCCASFDPSLGRVAYGTWRGVVVCGTDGTARTIDLGDDCEIDGVAWAGGGRWVVVEKSGRPVEVREACNGALYLRASRHRILAISPDGNWVALGGELIELPARRVYPHEPAEAATFDPHRREVVLADASKIWRAPLPAPDR